MASIVRLSWIPRSLASVVLVASPLLACEATPGSDSGGSSSSGEPTTGPGEASSTGVSTTGSSSESSAQGTVADDSSTGTTATGTDTEGPAPVPICEGGDCFVECTQELQLEDEQGNACSCVTAAVPPEWVWCNDELPFGCEDDYTCILEGLRDGILGRYSWGWSVKDEGGESVFLELVGPGRARAFETSFEERACCGVQSRDTGVYHAVFDLPAADDPFWEACLAMAPEIDPDALSIPGCLLPDALRVGECTGEHLTECPAG